MKKSNIASFIAGAIIFGSVGVFAGQYNATDNPFPIQLNGNDVSIEGYNIDGSTYFKLRDIADVVGGFWVNFYDNTIHISNNESARDMAQTAEAAAERKKKENSMPAYIREIKDSLGVPSNLDVTYKVSEPYYWSAGERNLILVDFYHNGQLVASVEADAITYEHIKGILMYTGQ